MNIPFVDLKREANFCLDELTQAFHRLSALAIILMVLQFQHLKLKYLIISKLDTVFLLAMVLML